MAGQIRLFEKTDTGLLVEVDPTSADKRRDGRRVSRAELSVDVLWTAEEDAARDAEEAAAAEAKVADAAATQARAEARAVAVAKLQQLGISEDDIKAVLD